jgi:uncharacterized protein (DUF1330 family)
MAGLWISHVEVTDPERYAAYVEKSSRIIPAHGGEFIVRGGRYQQMEGKEHPRNVVVRFATFEAALACYQSPEYQEIVGEAIAASNRSIVIVESND